MHLKKLLSGFFLFVYFINASGQSNDCEQTLNQASEEFNAGHFYGIPSLLKPCIDKNAFSNEQQVRAYLLLCQAYLIVDDPIAAEDSYLKLLKADPEYIATDEKDPIDVVFLSKKFTSTPIFTPRIRIGANTSLYRTIYDISTGSTQSNEKIKHVLKPGFQVGGGLDWNINDNFSICADVILSYKAFKTIRSEIHHDDTQTITEKQYWLDVPLYLKYSDIKGKIRPYGYAGIAANYLFSSHASMDYENFNAAHTTQSPSTGPDVKLTNIRRALSRSLVFGGGVRYKIGIDFIFADLRYMAGLSNLSTGTYDNVLAAQYVYADSKFRLDNLSISIGYVRPLYNPRKIKNARGARSLSRDIKKQSRNESK